MPLLNEKPYTVNDIANLPEDRRAELIDGTIYNLAAPSRIHQKIVHHLDRMIGNHIAQRGLPCDVYPAPFGVYLNDNYNYLEPDISVICDRGKLSDQGCEGAPDWIVEVVSPSSAHTDYLVKLLKYRTAGVRLYWIVDPDLNAVIVHDFVQGTTQRFTFSDPVPVSICDSFRITLADALS